MDVFAELKRFIEPFDASIIEAALLGQSSQFDTDGVWFAHHHGRPRTKTANAFDGDALLAGMQAVCFLGTYLAPNDPLRRGVPALYRKIVARLANPELLLLGGFREVDIAGEPYAPEVLPQHHKNVDNGTLVAAHGYTYFRPARLTSTDDIAKLRDVAVLGYPNAIYPYAGCFPAWSTVDTPGVRALAAHAGASTSAGSELDPRNAAPALVETVAKARGLDADAATLYLQLLTLVDCADVLTREINGWTSARHKKAAAALIAANLVKDEKQPRANRKCVLAGTWEKLFPPHPAVERWKLELYGAAMQNKALAAPLGRLVPLRPLHELFAAAWERVAGADAPESNRPTVAVGRDWIAEIRAAPDDDALRMVYGDWLTEQGDPRGELVTLQCRRVQLARAGEDVAELVAAETALIAKHGDVWAEEIHSFVEGYTYDRGFITSITVHAPTFVKQAKKLVAALPLLDELQLSAGAVGPIPRAHLVALAGCAAFGKISRLDFTADHYLMSVDELAVLLEAEYLPRLRWLRFGFHRGGEGFGKRGAALLADCERLSELRFLEIAGQTLELAGMKTLLAAPNLAKLEMLRVPYNALASADIGAVIELLEGGALPALRVLDVSNVVETDFVTAACTFYRNRVDGPRQHALLRALAARRGAAEQYAGDGARPPSQGGFTGEVLPQTAGFPFAERAKSGRAACVACRQRIGEGEVRIGIQRVLDAVGKVTAWVHPACRDSVPELQAIANLDERLRENSGSGVWPPE